MSSRVKIAAERTKHGVWRADNGEEPRDVRTLMSAEISARLTQQVKMEGLESWCDRSPSENCNDVRNLFGRRPPWSYVDVDLGIRVLIPTGITANRSGSWLGLRSLPTLRWQDRSQFVDESSEATFGFLFTRDRRAITGDIVGDFVNAAIHVRDRGIERVLGFFIVNFCTMKRAPRATARRQRHTELL